MMMMSGDKPGLPPQQSYSMLPAFTAAKAIQLASNSCDK